MNEILDENTIESVVLVNGVFKDIRKTSMWFHANNPLLGGISPMQMIMRGRSEKLLKFVRALVAGEKS